MKVEQMTTASWLLSSGGRRGSLVRFLKRTPITEGSSPRVVVTDVSFLTAAGHLADALELVPPVSNPDFILRTLEIALEHAVGVIIPTIDPELEVYARHRELFAEQGVNVWISSPAVTRLGWDKWALYKWLVQQGLPTVDTVQRQDASQRPIHGPVVAKPRNGSSAIGVIRADSLAELQLEALGDEYIVQSRATGYEITVDFAVGSDGRPLAIVPRRRLEVRGGEVSKAVTVAAPAVVDLVEELIAKLPGAYGALNVQLFCDPKTQDLRIIEINPRFGGGYPLTHLSGANFFEALLRDGRGERFRPLLGKPGTLMLRYDSEVIVPDYAVENDG